MGIRSGRRAMFRSMRFGASGATRRIRISVCHFSWKDVGTNDVDTNEVDTNEVDTNEVDTNEVDTVETEKALSFWMKSLSG